MKKRTQQTIILNGKELQIRNTKKGGNLNYSKRCINCEKNFVSVRSTALYCSDACRIDNHKENKRIEERERRMELMKKYLKTIRK